MLQVRLDTCFKEFTELKKTSTRQSCWKVISQTQSGQSDWKWTLYSFRNWCWSTRAVEESVHCSFCIWKVWSKKAMKFSFWPEDGPVSNAEYPNVCLENFDPMTLSISIIFLSSFYYICLFFRKLFQQIFNLVTLNCVKKWMVSPVSIVTLVCLWLFI